MEDTPKQVDETNPPESAETVKVAPNLENELDQALSKSFANYKPEHPDDPPQETVITEEKADAEKAKAEEPIEKEVKPKEVLEDKTPLADPDSLPANPPGKGSQQSKEGWNALRNNYRKAHSLVKERDAEVARLKASLAEKGTATQKEVEEYKKQIEDLARYRAMIDIQADPDFVSKFDQPIEKTTSTIKQMLAEMNVSQKTIDGIDFNNTKLMDEIVNHVSEHKDKFVAKKLQRKFEELFDLNDKRNETLEEQKKNYKTVLESKKKESFERTAQEEGRMIKHLEEISKAKDKDGKEVFPFLNKVEPREGATQPEIERVNSHNKMVDLMTQKVQEVLKLNSPEEKAEAAVAAVMSHWLIAQVKALQSQLQSAQAEIKKIANVTSESDRTKPAPASRNGNLEDTDGALNSFFANRR